MECALPASFSLCSIGSALESCLLGLVCNVTTIQHVQAAPTLSQRRQITASKWPVYILCQLRISLRPIHNVSGGTRTRTKWQLRREHGTKFRHSAKLISAPKFRDASQLRADLDHSTWDSKLMETMAASGATLQIGHAQWKPKRAGRMRPGRDRLPEPLRNHLRQAVRSHIHGHILARRGNVTLLLRRPAFLVQSLDLPWLLRHILSPSSDLYALRK